MIPIQAPKVDYFVLRGGLDEVSPPLSLKPGIAIASKNYEVDTYGGYRRIAGYERFDGRPSPSQQAYYVLPATITGTVSVGATLTGLSSSATGTVLAVEAAAIVLGKITGTYQDGEALQVAAVTVATSTGLASSNAGGTSALHAIYKNLVADLYRADIQAVPGSGRIRGVWVYNDVVYAFRDNVGATACVLHKHTAGGWSAVTMPYEIAYSTGYTIPAEGVTVRGHTSAATAVVRRVANRAGAFGSGAQGVLTVDTVAGTFSASETLVNPTTATITMTIASPAVITWTGHGLVSGNTVMFTTTGALPTGVTAATVYYVIATGLTANTFQISATLGGAAINSSGTQSGTHTGYKVYATSSTTATQITQLPGGTYETVTQNFGGGVSTARIYGCDGVNPGFEFDGTTFVRIRTGMTTDTPQFVFAHRNHLFYSFGASLQHSGIGTPYTWTVITGAAEIALGDTITGLVTLPGSESSPALLVTTRGRAFILYGSSSANWNLVVAQNDVGARPYTLQTVGQAFVLDDRGLMRIGQSQAFGNFEQASMSHSVRPTVSRMLPNISASSFARERNQYRVFSSDGLGLYLTLAGDQGAGIMPVEFPDPVRRICSAEMSDGSERIFFGSDDGFIYEMERGTSFDGEAIEAFATLSFASSRSPRLRKRYRRGAIEVTGSGGYTEFAIGNSLAYDSIDSGDVTPSTLSGTLGVARWDISSFDSFYFDARGLQPMEFSLAGAGENISLYVYSSSDLIEPYTLTGVFLHYLLGRQVRG